MHKIDRLDSTDFKADNLSVNLEYVTYKLGRGSFLFLF